MSGPLPDKWALATLGEVAEVITGKTPPTAQPEYFGGSIPFIKPPALREGPVEEVGESISEQGRPYARLVPADTVLISCIGVLGKTALTTTLSSFNQQINALIFNSSILPRYGFYFCQTLRPYLERVASATTIPIVNKKKLLAAAIPVPPLEEQRRIVEEIEKQFTRLDFAVHALEKARIALKRYRDVVLRFACEGRLVPTEADLARECESADLLLGRTLNERRTIWAGEGAAKQRFRRNQLAGTDRLGRKYTEPAFPAFPHLPQLPEGWCVASLEQLTDPVRVICYGILMPKEHIPDGIPYVRVLDMKKERIDVGSLRRTSQKIAAQYARASLQSDDLLLSIRGTYGRVAKVPATLQGGNITQDTARIALSRSVDPDYISIYLRSPFSQGYFKKVARGVAVKGVNVSDVRLLPVLLPPLGEQKRIVAEVQRRLSIIEEVEASVAAGILRAQGLRQSLLRSAFAGKLIPKCGEEEPASVLFDQIRKSREVRERNGTRQKRIRNATPRRGTGIKPGVSTPGTGTTPNPPKPRRGAGSVQESACAPTGLPDPSDGPSLGLKPQALRPGPAGAEEAGRTVDVPAPSAGRTGEEETGFLDLPRDAQIDLVWESLLGRGAREKEEAIRIAAQLLRDQGRAQFQRFRQGGPLYQAIATALDRGLREGSFDRPRRGYVRALLTDPKDYSPDEWRLCLLSSLDHEAIDEAEALRAAAEWGRENLGLEFARLREDGVILRGLRSALAEAVRRGEVNRKRDKIVKGEQR